MHGILLFLYSGSLLRYGSFAVYSAAVNFFLVFKWGKTFSNPQNSKDSPSMSANDRVLYSVLFTFFPMVSNNSSKWPVFTGFPLFHLLSSKVVVSFPEKRSYFTAYSEFLRINNFFPFSCFVPHRFLSTLISLTLLSCFNIAVFFYY